MTAFHDLEPSVINTALATQVLAAMFEDAHIAASENERDIRLTAHEAEMFSFLIYDLCARTTDLRRAYEAAYDASNEAGKKGASDAT